MISMDESMTFGSDFEPGTYTFSMVAGPQQMKAEFAVADGTLTGSVENAKDGKKDISTQLVEGAILRAAIDVLVGTLPLEQGAAFKFPVVDTQSGSLENVNIEVVGEEDVLVPAGSYATFKVRVKSSDGEQILYVKKDAPRWVVKQETPAQGLSMELKSLQM
jgi:hypothetical protein